MAIMKGQEPRTEEEIGGAKTVTIIKYQDTDGKWHQALEIVQRDHAGNTVGDKINDIYNLLIADGTEVRTLQDAATENGYGTTIDVASFESGIISITGVNVNTSTIIFEGIDDDANAGQIYGYLLPDYTKTLSADKPASSTAQKFYVDLRNHAQFRTSLLNLTGANAAVTVKIRMS